MTTGTVRPPLAREEFIAWVRREGEQRYHDHHRYHKMMHEGGLTRVQLQQWVLNRYYYQTRIPIKDAIILSKSEDPAFRRMWIRRIRDHDGDEGGEAGLELWLRLADGVGLDRDHEVGQPTVGDLTLDVDLDGHDLPPRNARQRNTVHYPPRTSGRAWVLTTEP